MRNNQKKGPRTPEAEPATTTHPIKPLPISGGAQACPEPPMPEINLIDAMRVAPAEAMYIARLAADAASRAAERQLGITPAQAGKAYIDAYLAALAQLSADSAPDPRSSEASPACPADDEDRTIAIITRSNGETVLEVGKETLRLTADEYARLKDAVSSPPPKGVAC